MAQWASRRAAIRHRLLPLNTRRRRQSDCSTATTLDTFAMKLLRHLLPAWIFHTGCRRRRQEALRVRGRTPSPPYLGAYNLSRFYARYEIAGLVALSLACALLATAAETNPFFAMDTALRDGQKRSWTEQAALLKELGYDGFGASGQPGEEVFAAFEKEGLKVFNTYITLSFDSAKPGLDPKLKAYVPRLKGHGTALWIAINGVTRDGAFADPAALVGGDQRPRIADARHDAVPRYAASRRRTHELEPGARLEPAQRAGVHDDPLGAHH